MEEEEKSYEKCKYQAPIEHLISDRMKELILKHILMSYRPLYGDDFTILIERDPILGKYFREIDSQKYILDQRASAYILKQIETVEKTNPDITRIKINGYALTSWGLVNRNYTALRKGASRLLDLLKSMYESTKTMEFSSSELAKCTKVQHLTLHTSITKFRAELEQQGLAFFTTSSPPNPVIIKLTERCSSYLFPKFNKEIK